MTLQITNPRNVTPAEGEGATYFAKIIDSDGVEWRYIGKAKKIGSRLQTYIRNVNLVHAGIPRRVTPGKEAFRGIHLALAKAVELGWEYEFYPYESVLLEQRSEREAELIAELDCNLNGLRSWHVEDYKTTTLAELAR